MMGQWGMSEADAIDAEFASLSRVAAESLAGAKRFADGAGRHGATA
jgi:enoyl-CoA hydratase